MAAAPVALLENLTGPANHVPALFSPSFL